LRARRRPHRDRLRSPDAAARRRGGSRRRRVGDLRGRAERGGGFHLSTIRPGMARVAHDEHELRRVIDEDREVDGLGEQELLELYRSMVLLRTYDERSEERRVGKECRSRWSRYHSTKKTGA